ncbi:hypothetical protein H4582DRAFT_482410 [Lactarius indigo]|nr:hypothetical protein H4582DRAFT_482410 [Lactarius indigo]
MNTTPCANRTAKILGLADDRFLQFTDSTNITCVCKMFTSLRRSASQSFIKHQQPHTSDNGDSSPLLLMVMVFPKTPGRIRFPGPRPTSLPPSANTMFTTRTWKRSRSHTSALD